MSDYIPDRGDAVWINMNPKAGHEQAGRRPAIVLSPSSYNGKVGLALFCPVTNQIKGYPFSDQIKSLDWKMRNTEFFDRIPETVILETFKKLATLLRFNK
jgi:mRNA interferase MazF